MTEQHSRSITNLPSILCLPVATAVFYLALFGVALWVYAVVWPNAPVMSPDSYGYLGVAEDLADLRIERLHGRPPGYPLFLVLAGANRGLFYSSLALHFVSIWLIAAVLNELGVTSGWLTLFGLLLLLPPYVEYAAYVLTENLSEFLLALSFSSLVFWFSGHRKIVLLLISGIAMAWAGLTRPTYQILALVISAFFLTFRLLVGAKGFGERRWIKACGVLLAISVLSLGGYSLLNYAKFKFFGIYPMTGYNLTNLTGSFLEELPDEYSAEREVLIRARDAQLIVRGGDHTAHDFFWAALPELEKITGLVPIPDLSQYFLHLNLILIRKAPLHYIQEVLTSFSSHWLPTATELANMNSAGIQFLWVALHFAVMGLFFLQLVVITGLAIFQLSKRLFVPDICVRSFQAQYFAYFLAGTIIFYNATASAMAGTPDPRYRIPTEPLILLMIFLGCYLWRELVIYTKSQ